MTAANKPTDGGTVVGVSLEQFGCEFGGITRNRLIRAEIEYPVEGEHFYNLLESMGLLSSAYGITGLIVPSAAVFYVGVV